jgi:hypothetical protein
VTQPIPDIYVLWHPDCALGETLARRIHAWLRPGNGLGPQVFYRSLPAPEAPRGGLPPPLAGEIRHTSSGALQASPSPSAPHTNMQVVLLLIDDHMIADAAWRHWLTRLAASSPTIRRVFLPVALDATAFNVPSALRELNFLRPSGLPLPELNPPGPPAAVEAVIRSLLKQLTEALCRLLLHEDNSQQPPGVPVPPAAREGLQPKIMLFLSHAKVDGTVPAKSIRDYIYSQTQLAAFYDENDIPLGSVFSRVLQSSLPATQTAAMIAVRSARYASRPWCRRELALFRRPVQELPEAGKAEQWRLNPTVVVDALDDASQTPGIPELGNAPLIRWSDKVSDQAEQIVTIVLRDSLLGSFHSSVGRTILTGPDCIVLNWLPDPTTLLHIPRVREKQPLRIVYPGRGLSGLELDILDEFFPNLSFESFDQVSP